MVVTEAVSVETSNSLETAWTLMLRHGGKFAILAMEKKLLAPAACSRVEQTKWQQIRTMDTVAAEIAEAHAEVTARRDQITLAQSAIATHEESYRKNIDRIRDRQGLPIEVLQAIQALDEAHEPMLVSSLITTDLNSVSSERWAGQSKRSNPMTLRVRIHLQSIRFLRVTR